MALSLGELVAMAQARENMKDVADRFQNAANNTTYSLGNILGYVYGGKLAGNLYGGQQGAQEQQYANGIGLKP